MRKMIPLLIAVCTCLSVSLNAQDKIYLKEEVKDGVVTEITDTEVKYSSGSVTNSIPRADVKLIFRKSGDFLSMEALQKASDQQQMIENFIRPAMLKTFKSDRIYTIFSKVIVASVYKEEDVYLYYKNSTEDDRIAKTSVAVVIYADGKHKVFGSFANAASSLTETETLTSGYTETKINYPPVRKTTTPVQQKNEPKVEPKVEEPKKAEPIAEKKEETKPVTPAENTEKKTTSSVMVLANKGAAITTTLNGEAVGTIKAGDFKKLELAAGTYKIVMDDKQGNVVEKSITVDGSGKPLNVFFPEVDYAGILKKQKDAEKAIEDQKKAEAQAVIDQQKAADKIISDQKKAEAAALAEQQRKEAAALAEQKKQEALAQLKTIEEAITKQQEAAAAAKEALSADSLQVIKGAKELDEASERLLETYDNSKKEISALLINYNETAAAANLKESIKPFLAQVVKNNLKFSNVGYIQAIKTGKRPMSASLAVALQQSRAADLKFFLKKEDIETTQIEGQNILSYALKNNAAPTVIQALLDMGAQASSFSKRLESNSKIYESPLALAAAAKNPANIRVLLDNGAKLYPPFAQAKDKRLQVKHVMSFIKDDAATVALFEKAGITMVDYEALLKKAVEEITSNMVSLQTGSFTIGCIPDVRVSCLGSETPAAEIKLKTFYISKFEITRAQWAAIMEEDAVEGLKECPNCPMSPVTYEMAINYILKLNEISGKKFRLPTEAEWEFAAAGGAPTGKSKFAGSEESNDVAWTSENSGGVLHPVGQKKPNALGLYDMSGNVAEWTSSWYIENYYTQIAKENPQGPEQGSLKVLRGGSFLQSNFSARVTRRWGENVQFLNPGVGFRLALSAE